MRTKALRFLPLAFLAGTHGFALFAPYVAVILGALHLRTRHRSRGRVRAEAPPTAPLPGAVPDPESLPVPA